VGLTLIKKADTGSNQPGKYGVQLYAQAYWYMRPNKYEVAVLKPKVDRISVTFDVEDPHVAATVRKHLIELQKGDNPIITKWKKRKGWGSGSYDRSYGLPVAPGKSILVQCAPISSPVSLLRVEFNPSNIGPTGVAAFRKSVPLITANQFDYTAFAKHGRVTRIDIAVDLVNIDIEDLLISTPKPGVTNGYFGITGKAETKYLNVNKSGSKLYVYDKKAALKAVGKVSEFGEAKLTRVERRTHPNVPIVALPEMNNRLKAIDILDIEAATPPEELHHWKLFQDACRYRGLAGALALLPADIRAAYEAAISDASATLWRPDDLWKTWPEALNTSGLLPA
jgi:hypothetical protein